MRLTLLSLITAVLFSSASGFASPVACQHVYSADQRISSAELVILGSLGKGQSSLAFLTQYKNKSLAFIKSHAIDTPRISIAYLTEKESQILANLSLTGASDIVSHVYNHKKYDFRRIGLQVPGTEMSRIENDRLEKIEQLSIALSELIVNYEHLKSMEGVTYQGQPILAKAHGIVVDPEQIPIGFLVEALPGHSLVRCLEKQLINRQQLEIIKKTVLEQASILHQHGFIHGDLNPGNIMVEILPNGQPRVRFIDPSAPAMGLISNPQFDIGIFNWGLSNLEKKFPLPY